jgi:hypothetical protein
VDVWFVYPLLFGVIAALLLFIVSQFRGGDRRANAHQAAPHRNPASAELFITEEPEALQVEMRPSQVINGTEARIYAKLLQVVPAGYWVFPQVRLADVVYPVHPNRSLWQSAQNRLALKHVDFAIVRMNDRMCAVVIEVDGPDHERRIQQQRDAFKDAALRAAGIPVVRLVAREYAPAELAQRLAGILGGAEVAASAPGVGLPAPKPRGKE